MKVVYAVLNFWADDYYVSEEFRSISGVFSTKEKAEEWLLKKGALKTKNEYSMSDPEEKGSDNAMLYFYIEEMVLDKEETTNG